MTHSLHRRGSVKDLHEDYVVLFYSSKGINREGSEEKMRQIWEVLSRYEQDLVNFGNHYPNWSGGELYNMEDLKKAYSPINMVVFKDVERLKACLKEIKERDFGISVVVSGLYEETKKICSEIGLSPHTVNLSLGIHGKTEKLPEENVLEIHTMCGHAVVPFNLILHMVPFSPIGVAPYHQPWKWTCSFKRSTKMQVSNLTLPPTSLHSKRTSEFNNYWQKCA